MNIDNIRKRLLQECMPSLTGIWQILGEDPNCDLSGYHSQPILGFYEGKYSDIVEYALLQPNFISWGHGGNINLLDIKPIKDINKIKEIQRLEREQNEIANKLKKLRENI